MTPVKFSGKIPERMSEGAAGFDLEFAGDVPFVLALGQRALMPTGVRVAIPQGYAGFVLPRSGLALKLGVTVVNAPGLIDSDYRGEVKVALISFNEQDVIIAPGDRIAQLVIAPVATVEPFLVDSLDETERGEGGFGSTG